MSIILFKFKTSRLSLKVEKNSKIIDFCSFMWGYSLDNASHRILYSIQI